MSTAIVSTKASLDTLRTLFEKSKPSIAAVLPKHLTAERILKITLSAASRTPDLLGCTPNSILLAVMQAAQLGLEPNTPLGESYLIPYRNRKRVTVDGKEREVEVMEAQFIPGYRGLIKLAIQSGEVRAIQARAVYLKDAFDVEYGLEERLTHKPFQPPFPPPRPQGKGTTAQDIEAWVASVEEMGHGPMVAVYAVAEYKGGGKTFELMWRTDVDAIRARSRSSERGPWASDYDQMALKTVIRRLCKRLPLSTEMAVALDHQARAEAGAGPDFSDAIDVLPTDEVAQLEPPKATATSALKERIGVKSGAAATTNGKGDGDDEPPPTGTDGTPRGATPDGEDHSKEQAAFEASKAKEGTGRAQARELTLVRDPITHDADFVRDGRAWEQHLRDSESEWAVAGAYHKRSGQFRRGNVLELRKAQAVAEIKLRIPSQDAETFLREYPMRSAAGRMKRAANG